jgi:hypothetical protein
MMVALVETRLGQRPQSSCGIEERTQRRGKSGMKISGFGEGRFVKSLGKIKLNQKIKS